MCHSFVDTLRTDLSSIMIAKFMEPLSLMKDIYHSLLSNCSWIILVQTLVESSFLHYNALWSLSHCIPSFGVMFLWLHNQRMLQRCNVLFQWSLIRMSTFNFWERIVITCVFLLQNWLSFILTFSLHCRVSVEKCLSLTSTPRYSWAILRLKSKQVQFYVIARAPLVNL